MKNTAVALVFLCIAFPTAQAQLSGSVAELKERVERRRTAIEALRRGEANTADAQLLQAVRGTPNTAPWHLEYAEHLTAAAIDLKDRDKYRESTEYFRRAAAQLNAALAAADAPTGGNVRANIYYKLGFFARLTDPDRGIANSYFKRALEADSANRPALAALRRTKEGRKVLAAMGTK